MLSHIQQATSFSGTNVTSNKAQSLELKILNALATIIVMNNEIVAVVANRDNGDGQLEVIACVHLIRDEEELTRPQPQNIGETFSQLFATRNPAETKIN